MKNGYKPKMHPSDHDISSKFGTDNKGAIPSNLVDGLEGEEKMGDPVTVPPNVISASNTSSNDQYLRLCKENGVQPHPARFPAALPRFGIGLCTEPSDLILDPFAGSNMTGYVAEQMGRRWISLELREKYLEGSRFRFAEAPPRAEETTEDAGKQEDQLPIFSRES